MKGIILAGGLGSRLYPNTIATSKQLLPIFDKPLIYYPLSVLMLAEIKDILIITNKRDIKAFEMLLGDGSDLGISISYISQKNPNGIAEAFLIGEEFIGKEQVCLILGDNIFYGLGFSKQLLDTKKNLDGATVFGYHVNDPKSFGVLEFDNHNNVINIEEKPKKPRSSFVVTGLYFYDNRVIDFAKELKPSDRGELEITDINKKYLEANKLKVQILGRGFAWLDTGTHETLLTAGQFIHTIENRQGLKVACLEEIAFNNGWINLDMISKKIEFLNNSTYKDYLVSILNENKE